MLNKKLSARDYGEIISKSFTSNFIGSELEILRGRELDNKVLSSADQYNNAGVIVGVPSINEKDDADNYDFQGMDRLINSMLGLNWRLVIVCEPVTNKEIGDLRESVYELYNRLSVCSKRNLQLGYSDGETISFSKNTSDTKGVNKGWNESSSKTHGESWGESHSTNRSTSKCN